MISYKFKELAVDSVLPNPLKPRLSIDKDELIRLADSIRQYGFFAPILVGKTSAGLQVIAGERRLRAAKMVGLEKIPAMVVEATSIELLLLSLEENLLRVPVNLIEQATAMKKLLENGLTPKVLASRLKISVEKLEQIMAVLDIPSGVQDEYLSGKMTDEQLLNYGQAEDPLIAFHRAKTN